MLGLGLGNTVEWYDWVVFGLLASFIGPQFFEEQDPLSATLDALVVFAIGFVARPLGGALLGNAADRFGRRIVMLLSVSMMAGGTLMIAVLPTYDTIGAWAGVFLLLSRILQGVSAGIEAPLSTAYAVELSPVGCEGRASGFISFFVNLGVLLASLVTFTTSYLVGPEAMAEWGWRVPLLVGAAMSFVVVHLRRALPETLNPRPGGPPDTRPWSGVRHHWLGLVAIVFIVGGAQCFNYAWNVGLPNLARGQYGESPTAVFGATTCLGLILLVGSLVTGRLADRFSLSRTFVWTRLAVTPTVFLMLVYSGPGLRTFLFVLVVGGIVLVANLTLYNLAATALMPQHCRATGMGLGYGVGVALFGGTAPYLLVWMQSRDVLWLFPSLTAGLSILSVALFALARRYSGQFAGR